MEFSEPAENLYLKLKNMFKANNIEVCRQFLVRKKSNKTQNQRLFIYNI